MGAKEYNQKQVDAGKLTEEMIAFLGVDEGDELVAKVKLYQAEKGLHVDGYCGPVTQAAILADLAKQEVVEVVVPEGKMTPEEVQQGLLTLGYSVEVDGDLRSAEFRSDLKNFQQDCRLTRDGIWGNQSEGKLKELLELLVKYGPKDSFRHCHRWHNTYYYVTEEAAYKRVNLVPVVRPDGSEVAKVPALFFASMALEGTGKLADGTILNVAHDPSVRKCDPDVFKPVFDYAKRMGWIPNKPGYAGIRTDGTKATYARTFKEVKLGSKGYPISHGGIEMDPFRTLAADNGRLRKHEKMFKGKGGVVPVKTKVFILEFAGQELPDGTTHDGWFTVNDTGGGIYGAHFDVFTGSRKWAKAFRPWPSRAHIWFEGVEDRLDIDYNYGLH
jgi:3D (Asp-Asp-Asp) domain-containing protein